MGSRTILNRKGGKKKLGNYNQIEGIDKKQKVRLGKWKVLIYSFKIKNKKTQICPSLAVQRLRLMLPLQWGMDLIPGWETKTLHALWPKKDIDFIDHMRF